MVLTAHGDANLAAEAFAAGANGFALKSDTRVEILEAVTRTAAGERYIAPTLPLASIEGILAPPPALLGHAGPARRLVGARARDLRPARSRCYSNLEIATELCISVKTVDTHRTQIFK